MPIKPLKEKDKTFAMEYIANGNNQTKAAQTSRPHLSKGSAAVTGSRLFRNVKIQSYIHKLISDREGGEDKAIIDRFIRNAKQTRMLQASNTANIELAKLKNLYPGKEETNSLEEYLNKVGVK